MKKVKTLQGMVYYFTDRTYDFIVKSEMNSELRLKELSELAYDSNTKTIVKCRGNLEELLDKALKDI